MATISKFEDFEIWQLPRSQAKNIFGLYASGVFAKDFALWNQVNAAPGSVMDNIAEGFKRSGNKEFIHFLLIAKASNGEVRSQLYRITDRKYITIERFDELILKCKSLSKKIASFIKYLKESDRKGYRYE